jgi:hypothetical protein
MLMADFDCVDDIQERAKIYPTPDSRSVVNYASKKMVTSLNLVNIWKKLNHGEPGYTFHHHAGSSRLHKIHASQYFVGSLKRKNCNPYLLVTISR